MRSLLVVVILLLGLIPLCAQEQERKLIDRLLRPNTELKNSAQQKQFVLTKTAATKEAPIRTFQPRTRNVATTYTGTREFDASSYAARLFRDGDSTARASLRSFRAKQMALPDGSHLVRAASDAGRTVESSDYAENRPFSGTGKSQKVLSQQDKPLTIEQVRELLNKNK